jgi:hypothetical protein
LSSSRRPKRRRLFIASKTLQSRTTPEIPDALLLSPVVLSPMATYLGSTSSQSCGRLYASGDDDITRPLRITCGLWGGIAFGRGTVHSFHASGRHFFRLSPGVEEETADAMEHDCQVAIEELQRSNLVRVCTGVPAVDMPVWELVDQNRASRVLNRLCEEGRRVFESWINLQVPTAEDPRGHGSSTG